MSNINKTVYLDNAATTWPKPPKLIDAINNVIVNAGGNPGRSGHHLSIEAGREILEARLAVADALGLSDPLHLAFTSNATSALNTAIFGLIISQASLDNFGSDRRIVFDGMIHNASARPLSALRQNNIITEQIACSSNATPDLDHLETLLKTYHTEAVIITHGSNVSGSKAPLKLINKITSQYDSIMIVDAAQTAGLEEIDLDNLHNTIVAFTGHKSMLGLSGTGGIAFSPDFDISKLSSFVRGGTGSASESELQPTFMPDKYESGTLNTVGLASLRFGLEFIAKIGQKKIKQQERELTVKLEDGLCQIPNIKIINKKNINNDDFVPVVSLVHKTISVSNLAMALDENYGICTRAGLQCAPRAHKNLNTYPDGTLRLSLGVFTTEEEIDYTINAIKEICKNEE